MVAGWWFSGVAAVFGCRWVGFVEELYWLGPGCGRGRG